MVDFKFDPGQKLALELDDRHRKFEIPLALQKRALELRASIYTVSNIDQAYRHASEVFEFFDLLMSNEYAARDIELVMGPLWHATLNMWASAEKACDNYPEYKKRNASQLAAMRAAIEDTIKSGAPGTKLLD